MTYPVVLCSMSDASCCNIIYHAVLHAPYKGRMFAKDDVCCIIARNPSAQSVKTRGKGSALQHQLKQGFCRCRDNILVKHLPPSTDGSAQMLSSAVKATDAQPATESCALPAAAAQGPAALPAEIAEVAAPMRGETLGTAAFKPVTTHTAAPDCCVPPAATAGHAQRTGDLSVGAAAHGQRLLSPADMVAALSTEPRETRLERTHAVLELAASPANRRRLTQRRSASAAVTPAAAPAPHVEPGKAAGSKPVADVAAVTAPLAEPMQAPLAGSEAALASIDELKPLAAVTGTGTGLSVPAPHQRQAPEPRSARQALSAAAVRPSVPPVPAGGPGRPSAGGAQPVAASGSAQPRACCGSRRLSGAAKPRSEDSKAIAAPSMPVGSASAVKPTRGAEATVRRQPGPSAPAAQHDRRDGVLASGRSPGSITTLTPTAVRSTASAPRRSPH